MKIVSGRVVTLIAVLGLAAACGKSEEHADPSSGGRAAGGNAVDAEPVAGLGSAGNGSGAAPSAGGTAGRTSEGGASSGGVSARGGTSNGGASAHGGVSGLGALGLAGTGGHGGSAAGTGGTGGHGGDGGGGSGGNNIGGSSDGGAAQAGSGCTGGFEVVAQNTGLCVAKTVPISTPAAASYGIDATEVTRGQYDAWLATAPPLPPSTDAACGWKSGSARGYAETLPSSSYPDPLHYPVAGIDWCDASAYCAAVGKHLCGAIGGGPVDYASYANASASEWFNACSNGGTNTYPYGAAYESDACEGPDFNAKRAAPVASLKACVTETHDAFSVYDLSGNVYEWENDCASGAADGSLSCRLRGGSFYVNENTGSCGLGSDFTDGDTCMPCGYGYTARRDTTASYVGFRCCSTVN